MQVLIIGAAGMVGRKLPTRLLEEGDLGGRQKTNLVLHDIVTPEAPQSAPFEVATLFSDFSMPDKAEKLIASRLDTIFWRPSCPERRISTRDTLLADYTRRGFFKEVGIRLPLICVRPG